VSVEPKRVRVGAEEVIPEDADLIELPRRALEGRLQRHTKSELKARFGTADFDEIKSKLDRLGELEKLEEDRKRAAMTEQERITADLERERQLRVDAERRVARMQEDQVVSKMDNRLSTIGVKHLRSKYVDIALVRLASHLRNEYTDAELAQLKDSTINEWFENFAKENPELARKPATAAPEAKPEVKKVPLTNGGRPTKPAQSPQSGTSQARSFAPSAESAMSPAEARAEAAKQGYRW
jgi:hypothetical protein